MRELVLNSIRFSEVPNSMYIFHEEGKKRMPFYFNNLLRLFL